MELRIYVLNCLLNSLNACVSRNGNVSCIEALIQASSHETNDDDVDGRTPLLLACLHGHHQAVQVLLSLGGDVTKRFDHYHTRTHTYMRQLVHCQIHSQPHRPVITESECKRKLV